jgi:hypothetical protein
VKLRLLLEVSQGNLKEESKMKVPLPWQETVESKRRLRDEALGSHGTSADESHMVGKSIDPEWLQVAEAGRHDRTARYLSELCDGKTTCEVAIEVFINR